MSNIYIPNHLKKLKIISDFYNMLTTYETENPLRTSDDFLIGDIDEVVKINQGDPVYYFTWCILRDKVLSEGNNEEYLHNIVTYITKLFYCVKGTMKVFDFMEKYLHLDFAESARFENGNTLVFKLSNISGFSSEFSVNFDNALRKFLSRLIYSSSLGHSYENIELVIEGDLKQTISSNVKVYKIFNVVLDAADDKITELEKQVDASLLNKYYFLGSIDKYGVETVSSPVFSEIIRETGEEVESKTVKLKIVHLKGLWHKHVIDKYYNSSYSKLILARTGANVNNSNTIKILTNGKGNFPGIESSVSTIDYTKQYTEFSNNNSGFEMDVVLGKDGKYFYNGFILYIELDSAAKKTITDYDTWKAACQEYEADYIKPDNDEELVVVSKYNKEENIYDIIFTANRIDKGSILDSNIYIKPSDVVFYGNLEDENKYLGTDTNLYGWYYTEETNPDKVPSLEDKLTNSTDAFSIEEDSYWEYGLGEKETETRGLFLGRMCQNNLAIQYSSEHWTTYLSYNYSDSYSEVEYGDRTFYEVGTKSERKLELGSYSEDKIASVMLNVEGLVDKEKFNALGLQLYINDKTTDTILKMETTEKPIETKVTSFGFKANVVSDSELKYFASLYKVSSEVDIESNILKITING
jgi:hypothetical protein